MFGMSVFVRKLWVRLLVLSTVMRTRCVVAVAVAGYSTRTSTSAADRYIRHVPYLDKLQPEGSPNFSYQTHVTDISIGRTCTVPYSCHRGNLSYHTVYGTNLAYHTFCNALRPRIKVDEQMNETSWFCDIKHHS